VTSITAPEVAENRATGHLGKAGCGEDTRRLRRGWHRRNYNLGRGQGFGKRFRGPASPKRGDNAAKGSEQVSQPPVDRAEPEKHDARTG
jgi:hypothetical protein